MGRISFTTIVFGVVLAYVSYSVFTLFKFVYPPECTSKLDSECLNPAFKSSENFQIFLCASVDSHPLAAKLDCFHHDERIRLDQPWSRQFEVTLPQRTLNNGSLFLHAVLTRLKSARGVDSNVLTSRDTLHTANFVTKYEIKQDHVFNLLEGDSNAKKKNVNKQKPFTHWRSKMYLSVLGEPFSIPRSQLPGEILHLVQLDLKGRYMPIFYLSDIRQRSSDIIALPDPIPKGQPVKMPLEVVYEPVRLGTFRLMMIVERAFLMMRKMGFQDRDIEDVKGLFFDTNHMMLLFTFFIVTFHALFDFLAFKNDIQFWRRRKSMAGVSFSSILFYFVSQCIITLYLWERSTSYLVLIPAGISACIELWKLLKVSGLEWSGWFTIRRRKEKQSRAEKQTQDFDSKTLRIVSFYVLPPLLIAGSVYSILYSKHRSLWSWIIETLVNFVYAFGFVAMLPQLIMNYRLKSVAHLPWRAFTYKAFNTFIDDFFAFLMTSVPTSHRLATFRDDIVFLIYLYQRWLYPIDKTRSLDGEEAPLEEETKQTDGEDNQETESKKDK